ncbi:nucleolar transcription factor 1-like [Jatropha curcas]|uniref:nucleolar transcription factor 1-like n=1 Tax=Jatropha curcas TaxID=180498 RepID=UPI0018958CD6|nr:nucleolar transcription factor 1-like [Jatropha curcas]
MDISDDVVDMTQEKQNEQDEQQMENIKTYQRSGDFINIIHKRIESKNVVKAQNDESWILAIQKELNQFERNQVWKLVPRPKNDSIIETKWSAYYEVLVKEFYGSIKVENEDAFIVKLKGKTYRVSKNDLAMVYRIPNEATLVSKSSEVNALKNFNKVGGKNNKEVEIEKENEKEQEEGDKSEESETESEKGSSEDSEKSESNEDESEKDGRSENEEEKEDLESEYDESKEEMRDKEKEPSEKIGEKRKDYEIPT